jgi:hypothetical protein
MHGYGVTCDICQQRLACTFWEHITSSASLHRVPQHFLLVAWRVGDPISGALLFIEKRRFLTVA